MDGQSQRYYHQEPAVINYNNCKIYNIKTYSSYHFYVYVAIVSFDFLSSSFILTTAKQTCKIIVIFRFSLKLALNELASYLRLVFLFLGKDFYYYIFLLLALLFFVLCFYSRKYISQRFLVANIPGSH